MGVWIVAGLLVLAIIALQVSARLAVTVYEWEHVLLYVDGRYVRTLPPGRHVVWPGGDRRLIQRLPAHLSFASAGPVDVVTSDRFSLRLTASIGFRVRDPRRAIEEPYHERLYRALNEGLANIASVRTLDELLGDRLKLSAALLETVADQFPELELNSAAPNVVLPPEIRRMMTDVERAKVEAQVALERARGEQAALRLLANAARMLKNNPDLVTLRTLQALSPTGKGATLVLGQGGLVLPVQD